MAENIEQSATGVISGKHEKLIMIIASVGGLVLAWYLYKMYQANASASSVASQDAAAAAGQAALYGGGGSSTGTDGGSSDGLSSADLSSIIAAINGGAGSSQKADSVVVTTVPSEGTSAGTTDLVSPMGTDIQLDFSGDNSTGMAIVGSQTINSGSSNTSSNTSSGGGGGIFSQIIGIVGGLFGQGSNATGTNNATGMSGGGTSGDSSSSSNVNEQSGSNSLIETASNTYQDSLTIKNATPGILAQILAVMQTPVGAASQQNLLAGEQTNTALELAGMHADVGQQAANQAGIISTLVAPVIAQAAGSTADVGPIVVPTIPALSNSAPAVMPDPVAPYAYAARGRTKYDPVLRTWVTPSTPLAPAGTSPVTNSEEDSRK